jgi:alpha-beta hydrolase superfamily lysophospholipase
LREEWLKDHLARFNLSPVELIKFQKFMSENHAAAKKIYSVPVLMIQGSKDKLVKAEGNQSLIHEIPCPDAQLVFIENAEHLILEEGQFDDAVITKLTTWLDSHNKNLR